MPDSQQSSQSQSQPLALYNPALLPPQLLLAEFTARRPLLDSLIEIVRNNTPDKPLQHALLVGARGAGKTTTLWAVHHTIQKDPELSRQWLPVVFDEESRRVGDLADFWLEALRQWEHAAKDPEDRAHQLLDKPLKNIEDAARNSFLEKVDRSGRRALLLVDNLNDLLSSIHDPEPLHRLRAFLMEDPRVMLLGTATRYFDQITHLDQPFHDFFRSFELRPLTLDEMKTALLALAEARGDKSVPKTLEERAGSIHGLYLLTGGNPRLIKTFYRLLTEGLRGDIRTDLERLLDEFTPYFKAVVDALPVQQQRIFDAVALAWDPVEVASVSRVTRVPSNQISAQLRALVKAGLISEQPGHPKRKTYLLTDRFSNIHYLMRHGRAARNRFDWFVALVRLMFPDAQAETLARIARQTAECGTDGLRDARDLLHSALVRAESAESRRQLLHAAVKESWDTETLASLSDWLDLTEAKEHLPEVEIVAFFSQMPLELRRKLGYEPAEAVWWCGLAAGLEGKAATALAEGAYRKAIAIDPAFSLAYSSLAVLLILDARPGDAEPVLREVVKRDPNNPYYWTLLGHTLKQLERYAEAEEALKAAITLDSTDASPWGYLGAMLADFMDRRLEAEEALRRAIKLDEADTYSRYHLARLLAGDPTRRPEAQSVILKVLESAPNSEWLQSLFTSLCGEASDAWRAALPTLAAWCMANPKNTQVFDFTGDGFLQFARLTKPADALALLESLPDASPFETLMDAFRAHADPEHLNRLAPERQALVMELLTRLNTPVAEQALVPIP
jgi:Flp pilus assembly protein TadD